MAGRVSQAAVEETLDRYRAVAVDQLLKRLPDHEPRRYLYDLIPSYPTRPGKGLRPGLCIASCRAFGGSTQAAMDSAVAIELFHNAFLVHDDLEDGSQFRRGGPTLHVEHGLPIAVNVGDAMNVLSIRVLMDNLDHLGPRLTWRVFAEIEHMVRESVEGQAMELGWIRDNVVDLTEADYLRMNLKKTCWYTCIHPCRIGALIGSGGTVEPTRFDRFGYFMGAAFQIQDDILNLIGERSRYGKEIGGDIWEGKRTLILIHLLNACTASELERMRRFLSQPRVERTPRQIRAVYGLLDKYDSITYARSAARQLAGAALREFFVAYRDAPDSDDKRFIEGIVLYMVEREL
jgi:geranylgeranyl diphosphate synthase type II